MTVWNEDRLARAAQIAGMKHKRDGRWGSCAATRQASSVFVAPFQWSMERSR